MLFRSDVVTVGSQASVTGSRVDAIRGLVTVNGQGGTDTLNVDDSGAVAASVGALSASDVTGLGMTAGIGYAGIESLSIGLGSGADAFTIQGTAALAATTLTTNDGDDRVVVRGTGGATTIRTNAGNDAVDVLATSAAKIGRAHV